MSLADEWFDEFIRRCQTPIGRVRVLAEEVTFNELRERHRAEQRDELVKHAERVLKRCRARDDSDYPFATEFKVTAREIGQWIVWLDEGLSHKEIGERAGLSAASVFRHVTEQRKRNAKYAADRAAFNKTERKPA